MFIVAPDGSAAQFSGSSWRGGAPVLAPGSAIIVPRDLRPFDPMRFSLSLTQILSSLAVSAGALAVIRSEEHTSELQSLMRISYAVFCLKKKNNTKHTQQT